MLDVGLAIIYLYVCLFTLGIGPALLVFGIGNTWDKLLGVAPAFGLLLITLVGTYLVLLDYPVEIWAFPILMIGAIGSLFFAFNVIKGKKYLGYQYRKHLMVFLAGLLIVIASLILPMIIGGLNYTVLRGNGTDSFNYITMAGYLLHEPYSFIFHSTIDTLINKNASYVLAQSLLSTRWSTSMLLAWSSSITHLPLYSLEFGFTTLFFIMNYGLSFNIARDLRLSPIYALLVAVSVCIGCWGQVLLDVRAMSQISAFPVFLFFVYVLNDIETELINSLKKQLLLGFTFTALIFLYVEIIPTILLGVIIFLLIQFLHKRYSVHRLFKYWLAVLTIGLSILPAAKYLLNFLSGQAKYAMYGKNNWHHAYFPWLYKKVLIGFWGMNYATDSIGHHLILSIFLTILAALLSIALLLILFFCFFSNKKKSPSVLLVLSSSFFVAAMTEFIFLLAF